MDYIDYFKILVVKMHSAVIATVDDKNMPRTRVIDIMLYDYKGIYFLTAKGKEFYRQLNSNSMISLSGVMGGVDTMSKKAITISGMVRNIGSEKLDDIFATNVYMADIYPTKKSRKALEVFCIYKGQGDYFDLSTKPITRGSFVFGGKDLENFGYCITDLCNGCGECLHVCPQSCIGIGLPHEIKQEQCLHCGNCYEVCPQKAVCRTE